MVPKEPTFARVIEELRADIANVPMFGISKVAVFYSHLSRVLRKTFVEVFPILILSVSSFSVGGNAALAVATVGVFLTSKRVGLVPKNTILHVLAIFLVPLAFILKLATGLVYVVLIVAVLSNRLARESYRQKCAPKSKSFAFELFWLALWCPQVAIGAVTFGIQRHQPSNEFLWSLARVGYRTEPWILGLTCLIFIIAGALKSADRGFQK